ncbi:histone-lysine N-methyltransferase-1 [Coleophoma crateriformis]|uniref:Histone-lysine N-methyltransferase, H3 lysine-36 specific n=1 Tax=Coleophoma crateriformis TaxID=565419 RepID=A0A3D8RWN8_9HELO|nr:histone-lysine N-methyltransferase-1 [Coleophoma crateriformis]
MADEDQEGGPRAVDAALSDMKLEGGVVEENNGTNGTHPSPPEDVQKSPSTSEFDVKRESQSPASLQSDDRTPKSEDGQEEVIGGGITFTVEPGKAPKLLRKSSQKIISRPARLFDHVEDSTEEATSGFQPIRDCIYGSKYMGYSEHDALDCDCSEEWRDGENHACGEDSDCINRATKMECVAKDCNCGLDCQNQRFQRKQYANVSVIKTEKKGYGLRANTDLQPNDFIFEYIGEVINEPAFRRRMVQYDQEGIKHFYFMSLTKSEFVDATKKGNLGRFCNHSCNPNCYVDKWVVGEKLRMGIFAERHIKAGEELVFNYNVDRYGADPQPCYCGEPNCTGFIGGKTQTERATKLSHATIEALGIDDGDGWDTAVAKKPRKKKTGEDDEEYVNNVQPKGLDENGVRKVMATLMQCKEKWIAVKLLSRLQRCDDDRVRNRVVQMHGYQILRTTLTTYSEDNNVVLQVFDILYKFPRLTRNKISDSKIEPTIEKFVGSEHEDVAFEAKRLLDEWGKLEVAYRIPRKKFDPNAQPVFERRASGQKEEAVASPTPAIIAPTGPRNSAPQRNNFVSSRLPPRRPPPKQLPTGWFAAQDSSGNTYYYSKGGQTTWQRPFQPAPEAPATAKAPLKSLQTAKALQDIIDSITKSEPSSQTPKSQSGPASVSTPKEKKSKPEKWRSLPQEKQMKLYENTLFPHIKHVMQKYSGKLPKDDLKKFAKEVGKKLVASDFKNNRVEDPTKISEKQEKKVKKYVRDFFEKAVEKKKIMDRKKAERAEKLQEAANGMADKADAVSSDKTRDLEEVEGKLGDEIDIQVSDDEDDSRQAFNSIPTSPNAITPADSDLKRKRDDDACLVDEETHKRLKDSQEPSPPPPPPPPPVDGPDYAEGDELQLAEEQRELEEAAELKRQEEDLMRENEEAMLEDMESGLVERLAINGSAHAVNNSIDTSSENGTLTPRITEVNGNGVKLESSEMEGVEATKLKHEHERKSVLSH